MLNLKHNGVVLFSVPEGGWLYLPDGKVVCPAQEGWTSGVYSLEKAEPPPEPPADVLVRAERNLRLANSDWTQLPDAPVDQAAWVVYRQALRDVPAQAGFPANVIWPTQPE